ncbi:MULTISPECIES: PDZ domain-containing protein [Methylotenera]|uniref:PDZ domain-containing protein n=1 Tax=Methylotenera TaxID=359407 RepID=UPI000368FB22|nr:MULTISPECIES: PDZ domain-containing protein [Methylotenera]
MLPVRHQTSIKKTNYQPMQVNSARAKSPKQDALVKKGISPKLMLGSLLTLGIFLLATQLYAAETANPTDISPAENWYAKSYKAQNSGNLASLQANPDTKMYVSNHKEEDDISMLENGYDLMGSSGFTAGDVPAEQALAYAKALKADTVLVYSKYGTEKTPANKIALIKEAAKAGKALTEKDLEKEQTNYNYYASYWAKLPKPLLGVHVIKLSKKELPEDEKAIEEEGLKVIAVIKNSAAAKANLKRGDVLIKLGDTVLEKPEQLSTAARKYQGQTVAMVYERAGQPNTVEVAINQR